LTKGTNEIESVLQRGKEQILIGNSGRYLGMGTLNGKHKVMPGKQDPIYVGDEVLSRLFFKDSKHVWIIKNKMIGLPTRAIVFLIY
jgi:hypothetical protein